MFLNRPDAGTRPTPSSLKKRFSLSRPGRRYWIRLTDRQVRVLDLNRWQVIAEGAGQPLPGRAGGVTFTLPRNLFELPADSLQVR
ncbi:MAG: hypothetical protein D6715_03795 [Calditrichaeota bacterium]|nr:MAG: hypothetical protein D6715_03795 [Calditrichota bacterium]